MKALIKKNGAENSYSFTFVSDDGTVVLKSEKYKAKDSADKGVRAVIKNCTNDKRIILETAVDGRHYYSIKSGNGLIVATSVMYSTEQERAASLSQLRSQAIDSPTQEKTLASALVAENHQGSNSII